MHAWEQIGITLDYIEDHLGEPTDIAALARLASLSPFYYQRLFSRLVKRPVAEYTKLRRMAKATEALLQPDKRILDIAVALGFSSHAHFTRTFKETFGMTPEEYRRNPQILSRMTKPQLHLKEADVGEGVPLIAEGIVLEITRHKSTAPEYFAGYDQKMPVSFLDGLGTESGVDPLVALWDAVHAEKAEKAELAGAVPDGDELGVTHPCEEEGYFNYFAGAQIKPGAAAEGHAFWVLEPGAYLVCSVEAESFQALVMDVLYKAQQYLYGVWLPKHGLQTEPFCAERYRGHGREVAALELWMKLK